MSRAERYIMPEIEKQPYEEFYIFWDFFGDLVIDEALLIGGCAVAVENKNGVDATSLLVDTDSMMLSDAILKIRCRAGEPALSPYKVSFRCTTDQGNKYEGDVQINVIER